ncbi:MAG: hypothetical protein ACOYL6_11150 [Bacteriovoracaceae bacterium]
MLKTITYFFLFYTFFSSFSFAQEVKEGLYFLNAGLANRKDNTRKYIYGIGFNYRYSKTLDFTGLGIRHHFKLSDEKIIDVNEQEEIKLKENEIQLSYGLENSDTQKYGLKYPFYIRGQYDVHVMDALIESHFTDRYYPDFYDSKVLHFASFGSSLKKDVSFQELTFHAGAEISRLWHTDHKWFANYFMAFQKSWSKKYFTRLEYSDNLNNSDKAHIKDWLATATLGYIY